jgi:hypothetical protein
MKNIAIIFPLGVDPNFDHLVPLFRVQSGKVYGTVDVDHHYTTSIVERDSLVASGWVDEGVAAGSGTHLLVAPSRFIVITPIGRMNMRLSSPSRIEINLRGQDMLRRALLHMFGTRSRAGVLLYQGQVEWVFVHKICNSRPLDHKSLIVSF